MASRYGRSFLRRRNGGTAAQRAFGPGNVFDWNLYFCEGAEADSEFGLNPTGSGGSSGNKSYNGLAAWRTAVGSDANSTFHDPGFAVAVPGATRWASAGSRDSQVGSRASS